MTPAQPSTGAVSGTVSEADSVVARQVGARLSTSNDVVAGDRGVNVWQRYINKLETRGLQHPAGTLQAGFGDPKIPEILFRQTDTS